MNFVSTAATCPTCAPFLTGSVHKRHAFIFTSLRRIYLGDAQDSRREEIVGPRLDIATLKIHIVTSSRNSESSSGGLRAC